MGENQAEGFLLLWSRLLKSTKASSKGLKFWGSGDLRGWSAMEYQIFGVYYIPHHTW